MKYKIKRGDTLSEIAQKFDTTVAQLMQDNNIKNQDLIFAGATLQVKSPQEKVKQMQKDLEVIKQKQESLDVVGPKFILEEGKEKEKKLIKEGKKRPPKREQNKFLPLNVRQFFYDVFGGTDDITEDDLSTKEKEALIAVVKTAKNKNKNVIEYEDYETEGGNDTQYADVGGAAMDISTMFSKLKDPKYSIKTTLGQASIKEDKEGNIIIEDQYNFNDAKGQLIFSDFMDGVKKAGFNPYAQARNVARYFGSGQGEGSKVKINLGKIL